MTERSSVPAVGIAWYRREDYAEILRIMQDAAELPTTWEKWFYAAERGARVLQKRGHIVVRAYIDPVDFPEWCRQRGLKLDAQARMQYANEYVYRQQTH